MLMLSPKSVSWRVKPLLFSLCLLPFLWLLWGAFNNQLGTNPVETLTHQTGDWTLRLLLLTLAITPLRRLTGWSWLLRLRRMLGLYTFFYACLHFLTYIWFDHFFDMAEIIKDIAKRPFVTIGFMSFVLLIPLAMTSTQGMMRRLGRKWKKLHQLVYLIAILSITHFIWLVKADLREPLLYAALFAVLMLIRSKRVQTFLDFKSTQIAP